jgi:hypothetical protein
MKWNHWEKNTVSFIVLVVVEQLGSHWTDFYEIFYSSSFSKLCRTFSSFIKI